MKLHTGDTVIVISGKDKGKQGTIIRVLAEKNHVVVEGLNMRVRHIKKTAQQAGQRISYEASMDASKVMIIDPKTKKPTRIGYKVDAKTGNKVRVARSSGEVLPIVAKAKAAPAKTKKSAKADEGKPADKVAGTPKEKGEAQEIAASKMPTKQPFWKKAFSGATPEDQSQAEGRNRQEEIDKNSPGSIRRSRES